MEIESIMNMLNIMVIKSEGDIKDLYELFKYYSTTNSYCKNICIDLMKNKKNI